MKCLLSIALVMFIACQNPANNFTSNTDSISKNNSSSDSSAMLSNSVKTVALHNGTQCFLYTKDKDTISMKLVLKDSNASGDLMFDFYEKDKNKGTIKGILKNDTLLADYTFSSEGMRSVRQVVFLLKGNIFLSGSGSMKEQSKRMVFSNEKDISFDNTLILKPVDCETSVSK